MDEWLPVENFDNYLVNKRGDVVSLYRRRLLTPRSDKDGYLCYILVDNNSRPQTWRAHRLVLATFSPVEHYQATKHHE